MHTQDTNIHEAAFSGDILQLRMLVDEGKENVNKKDEVGQTALHKAAMNGWVECVSFLLDRGATVNTQDIAGCTALHLTAANGYRDSAQCLIEKGKANINQKTNRGHTPQHMARSRGQIQMAAFLNGLANNVGPTWMS